MSLRKPLGLGVDEGDINKVIMENKKELSNEELNELQMMQHMKLL